MNARPVFAFACLATAALSCGCSTWSVATIDARRGTGATREFQASSSQVVQAADQAYFSRLRQSGFDVYDGPGGVYAWTNDLFGGVMSALLLSPAGTPGTTKAEALFSGGLGSPDVLRAETGILDAVSKMFVGAPAAASEAASVPPPAKAGPKPWWQ